MDNLKTDDIRAAVAAGILDETQSAGLLAIAQNRAGYRSDMQQDDEPFEFFRGFSEIFITVGLCLLFGGLAGLMGVLSNFSLMIIPFGTVALSFWMSFYFTVKRRMILPSIFLSSTITAMGAAAIYMLIGSFDFFADNENIQRAVISICVAAVLCVYYRYFKLPFSLFLIALSLLAALMFIVSKTQSLGTDIDFTDNLFDLTKSTGYAITMLIFGIFAFIAGMWFDMKDPHRLGRFSANGFWLHILAAPALVNTLALTLFNMGNVFGYVSTALVLLAISLVAIIIDRRSFLTAGIIYMALVLSWAFNTSENTLGSIIVILILGIFITGIGSYWTKIRIKLMRLMPDYRWKEKLPPYKTATEE